MRVIAGELGGRTFASPHTHRTHPMSDRIRGALFATLGDIVGLTVLDAFAGTGALGFEAASRGASSVLQLENDPAAQRVIVDNISSLGLGATVKLVRIGCNTWSTHNANVTFDLVLADPPFDDLQLTTVSGLMHHVNQNGVFVLNWPKSIALPSLGNFELISHKTYGDAQLGFFKH